MSEKLCLKWNDFQENLNSAFGSLREDTEFADVTLACEDGQQVEAHKVILAATSPFFQNLLRKKKHPHPLIYMRGVKSEDLVGIVDFLYYGEANVYQENIDGFLAIAEELKLNGLTGNKEMGEIGNSPKEYTRTESIEKPKKEQILKNNRERGPTKKKHTFLTSEHILNLNTNTLVKEETQLSYKNQVFSGELQALDEQIKSMMSKSQNIITYGNNKSEKASICTVCGKEGKQSNIKDHIEANHIEGLSIPCNFCEKTFLTRPAYRMHRSTYHK